MTPPLEDENRVTERVRVFVGDRKRPTLSFDLRPSVDLIDALAEIVASTNRRRAALAAEPASGETKLEEFDGPIMATLVQNNAALVAERDAAREYGVQARLREKAAEDKRIHDTDALRAKNAELVAVLSEVRTQFVGARIYAPLLARIDAALRYAAPPASGEATK